MTATFNAVQRRRLRLPWFVAFLGWRLVWAAVTMLVFLAAVIFLMEVWVPYSWQSLGSRAPVEDERNYIGLYLEFLLGLARGDLGTSFGGMAVIELISDALPVTLTVFIVGAIIGWVVGEMLGRVGTWSRNIASTSLTSVLGVLSAAIFPPFLVFLLVFSLREPLLASREALGLPTDSLELWRGALTGQPGALMPSDVWWVLALSLCAAVGGALLVRSLGRRLGLQLLEALALPATLIGAGLSIWLAGIGPHVLDLLYRADITVTTGRGSPIMALIGVALLTFGQVTLLMRAGMSAQRGEDYVLTGRAKGLPEHLVRDRHVSRNAIPPVLAGSFLTFPTVLAGMMILEYELELQGLSTVLFNATESQDIPVILGILVILGLIGVGFRLVTDVAIAALDPRRRGRS